MEMHYIEKGTSEFRRVTLGLFIGGLVTFAVLYCTQPLLPLYSHDFHVAPATASLAVSITTVILAVMMTFAAAVSNAWGRKRIMALSLWSAALVTLVSAWSPNFFILLLCRALIGIVLAGIPAIAMAYLGEEVHPRHLGAAMGMYIGGNAIGGMFGRIISGLMTDLFSWRVAIAFIGCFGLFCAFWFWKDLPQSAHFVARPFSLKRHLHRLGQQLRDPGQLCLYGIAFMLMGGFVTLYSYLGYQLIEPPYNLSQAAIGWIFVTYLVGSLGSAWMGRLADRWSRRGILLVGFIVLGLGVLMTLEGSLLMKILGVAVVTFAFFGCHAIASGWVGQRAGTGKAEASALYLFFYYVGSSVGNTMGGFFWSAGGWYGVVGMILSFVVAGLTLALVLPLVRQRANAST